MCYFIDFGTFSFHVFCLSESAIADSEFFGLYMVVLCVFSCVYRWVWIFICYPMETILVYILPPGSLPWSFFCHFCRMHDLRKEHIKFNFFLLILRNKKLESNTTLNENYSFCHASLNQSRLGWGGVNP